jgi:anti-sigma-K factor RskA
LSSHEEYKELLVPHSLDALETAEARTLEDHLLSCSECRDEMEEWRRTSSSLALAASSTAEPSPEVRNRILSGARAMKRSTAPQNGEPDTVAYQANVATAPAITDGSNVIPLRPRRASTTVMRLVGTIAACLLIALLLVGYVLQVQRNRAIESDLNQAKARLEERDRELARLRDDKGFITGPDANMVSLSGTEMARDARAKIAFDRKTGRAMLMADNLPPAPAGKAYQLWFIVEGKPPMPGGVFTPDTGGHAELRDQMPPEGREAGVFAVTLEKAGGVSAPEGKAYLQGKAAS